MVKVIDINLMRGSRSTAKSPIECKVNTSLPFIKQDAPLRIVILLDPRLYHLT